MIFLTLEHIFTHISFSIVSIVIIIYFINLFVDEIIGLSYSSKKGIIASFFCITGFLITRWIASGHFPLSDLYESFLFLSWNFSIIHLYLKKKKNYIYLNAITTSSSILTQIFATSGLLTELHEPKILVPALQSRWLMMHVSMMVLGYAALLCGSLLSVALLVILFREVISVIAFRKFFFLLNDSFSKIQYQYMNQRKNALLKSKASFPMSHNYYRYQVFQQLDDWTYRIISLGFIFLTIGILSGAVWANEAWGSYWNWDPKETWAFITWTLFSVYLHMRTNQNWQGLNSSIVASIGFIIIWICYFGVNLLGIGLHSYGSFTLT